MLQAIATGGNPCCLLTFARRCARDFVCINSSKSHNKVQHLASVPFYRCGDHSTERFSDLPGSHS